MNTIISTDVSLAAKLIKEGETVAFPTETVYGLGANAFDAEAVKKIFAAKNRPADNPLIVHLADKNAISSVAAFVPDTAYMLMEKFCPGPLTIVLNKKDTIPDVVTAGLKSVGIRFPSHPTARKFLSECALPVAAPSANRSTRLSPTTAEAVFEDMDGKIPLILDGGHCGVGIESTVLSLVTPKPYILRPGIITLSMIKTVLPEAENYVSKNVSDVPSPGVRHKHYAPTVEFSLFDGFEAISLAYDAYVKCGMNPVIVCLEKNMLLYNGKNVVSAGENTTEVAKNIFDLLRRLEKKYDAILSEKFGFDEVGLSVMNRLNMAAKK